MEAMGGMAPPHAEPADHPPRFCPPSKGKNYLGAGTDLVLCLHVPTPSPAFALPKTETKMGEPNLTCAYPYAPSFRSSLGRKFLWPLNMKS